MPSVFARPVAGEGIESKGRNMVDQISAQIDLCPQTTIAFHRAHKERLQRFAQAAAKNSGKAFVPADIQQTRLLEKHLIPTVEVVMSPLRPRRDYENAALSSLHIPIVQRILRAVSLEFGLSIPEIVAPSDKKLAISRFVAIGLMLDLTNLSLPSIGRRLGGRDHTTILHGRERINTLLKSEAFRNRFDQMKASIMGERAA
jgi:hypothetical protein